MCRVKGCKKPEHSRGVCRYHYNQAHRLKHTDPEKFAVLEKSGVLLPAYNKGQELRRLAESLAEAS